MKKSFILFTDVYEDIKDFTPSRKGELLDAIYQYAITGKVIKLSPLAKLAFGSIARSIDRESKKWEIQKQKRVDAGRLGGLAKARNLAMPSNAKQRLANLAVSVSGSVINKEQGTETKDEQTTTSSYKTSKKISEVAPTAEELWMIAEKISEKGGSNV